MVLERFHISLVALHVHQFKVLVLGQRPLTITHTVTLQIGLGSEVDAVLVAQVIPAGVVGIVTRTYRIDVQLLHNLDVLNHALYRDDIAAVRIQLVAVGTLDEDGLTVEEQLASFDFDMAEAYTLAYHLQHLVALAGSDVECIQVGRLCRPRFGAVELGEMADTLSHQLAGRVVEVHRNLRISRGLDVHVELCLAVHIVLLDGYVLDVLLGTGTEIHLAGNTRKSPEVLVLQVGAVTPAHHLHGDEVLASLQVFGDVKLCGHLGIF